MDTIALPILIVITLIFMWFAQDTRKTLEIMAWAALGVAMAAVIGGI